MYCTAREMFLERDASPQQQPSTLNFQQLTEEEFIRQFNSQGKAGNNMEGERTKKASTKRATSETENTLSKEEESANDSKTVIKDLGLETNLSRGETISDGQVNG